MEFQEFKLKHLNEKGGLYALQFGTPVLTDDCGTISMLQKAVIQIVDELDEKVFKAIADACREYGINEAYVVDRKKVATAIMKANAKKVILCANAYVDGELYYDEAQCPTCKCVYEDEESFGFSYCPTCGQRLDWSELSEAFGQ